MRAKGAAFGRFAVVGSLTAVVSALGVHVLVRVGDMTPLSAAAVVAVIGNLWGFYANRHWSFLASHDRPLRQFFRYMAVSAVAIVTSVALFAFLTEVFGVHYVVASLAVSALYAVANFLAHFHWSFAPAKSTRSSM